MHSSSFSTSSQTPSDGLLSRSVRPRGLFWVKALVDYLLALGLFLALLPLLAILALLVRLSSRGPAIYSQLRVGRNNRLFWIYKFRTMKHDCEKKSGACWSVPGDNRVTALGKFLRATHLDELPQLVNVLLGHMSLVGPRPERPEFTQKLAPVLPQYEERHLVLPGVTGIAQVQLPPDSDLKSVARKLAYDRWYVAHRSLWLDIRLIVCTALKVVRIPMPLACALLRIPSAIPVGCLDHLDIPLTSLQTAPVAASTTAPSAAPAPASDPALPTFDYSENQDRPSDPELLVTAGQQGDGYR